MKHIVIEMDGMFESERMQQNGRIRKVDVINTIVIMKVEVHGGVFVIAMKHQV